MTSLPSTSTAFDGLSVGKMVVIAVWTVAVCTAVALYQDLPSAVPLSLGQSSGAQQPVSGGVNVGGSNNPTFVGTASGNTFNFFQTVKTTEESGTNSERGAHNIQLGKSISSRKDRNGSLVKLAADRCEEALKSRYETTGSYVKMIPWVDDDKKHIMDIYTKLQLEKGDDEMEGNVETYDDIFLIKTREGHPIKRAICCGFAGLGKSTLIDKIAYDWAVGICDILKKYKLVFVLKMHALKQDSELIDAVFHQLLDKDTPVKRYALKAFIDDNPDKILILLDGFDEFMTTTLDQTKFGSILQILNRKEGRECCVLVTTRPSHFENLVCNSLIEKPFTSVKVLGFSAADMAVYVNKFYSDKSDKARGLLQRIRSSDVLFDLAKSPMLLLLMCLLWRKDSTLPDTMSRLYNDALRYIFKRKANMSPEEIATDLIEVGKIAFCGLVSPMQHLSFQEGDFEKSVLDVALRAGLLTSQRVLNGLDTHHSVHFIHKTFQEFCAAKYCQSLSEDSEEFQKVLDRIDNPCAFEYLLRFCCGDCQACTICILRLLEENHGQKVSKLALDCYFECQSVNVLSEDFIGFVLTDDIDISCNDHLTSFMYFMQHFAHKTKDTSKAYLTNVQKFQMDGCTLHRFSEDSTSFISRMTNLSSFRLINCFSSGTSMSCVLSSLKNATILTKLELLYMKNIGGSAGLFAPHLKHLKDLTHLTISASNLSMHDAKCLTASIACLENLEECSVDVETGWLQIWKFSAGIELHMYGCSLTGGDLRDILEVMSHRSDLLTLMLRGIDGLSGSAAFWSPHLKLLTHLQELGLRNCSLQSTDIEHIAATVSAMPTIGCLNLKGNASLRGSAKTWAPNLQQLTHIRSLILSACSLTDEDKDDIVKIRSGRTTF